MYFASNYIGRLDDLGRSIDPLFKPETWNQWDRIQAGLPRSDAAIEGFHHRCINTLGTHPAIGPFISRLHELSEHYAQMADRIENSLPIGHSAKEEATRLESELDDAVLTFSIERRQFQQLGDDDAILEYLDKIEQIFNRHAKMFELLETDEDNQGDNA